MGKDQAANGLLKFITCGSVDDGKSTLIGHILYDTKLLYTDQEQALELDSKVGFKGIFRKVLIFTLVGIADIIDIHVLGEAGVLRTAVIFFYISNEGVSLLENSAHLGLPIPEKLKNVLEQLHDREGGKDNESK